MKKLNVLAVLVIALVSGSASASDDVVYVITDLGPAPTDDPWMQFAPSGDIVLSHAALLDPYTGESTLLPRQDAVGADENLNVLFQDGSIWDGTALTRDAVPLSGDTNFGAVTMNASGQAIGLRIYFPPYVASWGETWAWRYTVGTGLYERYFAYITSGFASTVALGSDGTLASLSNGCSPPDYLTTCVTRLRVRLPDATALYSSQDGINYVNRYSRTTLHAILDSGVVVYSIKWSGWPANEVTYYWNYGDDPSLTTTGTFETLSGYPSFVSSRVRGTDGAYVLVGETYTRPNYEATWPDGTRKSYAALWDLENSEARRLAGYPMIYYHSPIDLNELAVGTGWHLSVAYDVNGEGAVIGIGKLDGADRVFLATPIARPDGDDDGIYDDEDNCPNTGNPDQIDQDLDGIGNACDDDLDGDGVENDVDNCPDLENPDQADLDVDGGGDGCDDDADGDSVNDDVDNCLGVFNEDQADSEGDGLGDACDDDDDDDGVVDAVDNCVVVFNPAQYDFDLDGEGDDCDGDEDGDGVENLVDACPGTALDAAIDIDGCSGAQRIAYICGPPADHENHGQYVSCVAHEANQAVDEGLLTNQEKARFVTNAARG